MMKQTLTTFALLTVLASGCGRREAPADLLPPLDTLHLAAPAEDVDDSAQSQALCASDTAAYDDLVERIGAYNEALRDRIALLRLAARGAARALERDGAFVYTATRGDFTLTLTATEQDDGTVVYDSEVENGAGEVVRVLTGTANAERSAGTWSVDGVAGRAVDVEWSNDGETLTVARTVSGPAGERSSVTVRDASTVTVDFAGENHDAQASWDRDTLDGQIAIDGVVRCFDVDAENADVCTVPCP